MKKAISILFVLGMIGLFAASVIFVSERCWEYETYTEWWGDYGGLDKYVADTEKKAVERNLQVPLYEKGKMRCIERDTIYNQLIK